MKPKALPQQKNRQARRAKRCSRGEHKRIEYAAMIQKLTASNVRLRAELNLLHGQPRTEAINNAALDCAREMTNAESA